MSKTFDQLTELTVPDNSDIFPIDDVSSNTTKKITRSNFLKGAPLPADTVDTQAVADNAITPAKRSGGVAIGTVTISATGNVVVSGLGFQPTCVEFFYAFNSAGLASDPSCIGHGMMTSTAQYSTYMVSRASTTHGNSSGGSSDKCIEIYSMTSAGVKSLVTSASYVSLDSGGFTINVATLAAASTDIRVQYKAIR